MVFKAERHCIILYLGAERKAVVNAVAAENLEGINCHLAYGISLLGSDFSRDFTKVNRGIKLNATIAAVRAIETAIQNLISAIITKDSAPIRPTFASINSGEMLISMNFFVPLARRINTMA